MSDNFCLVHVSNLSIPNIPASLDIPGKLECLYIAGVSAGLEYREG